MKNIFLPILVLTITLFSCKNAFEKELQEIADLHETINNTEEVLLSVDTAVTFALVREIKQDLWQFGNKYDSLNKEDAFQVAEYYSNKKSLYYFYENHHKFTKEIEVSRNQLDALKKDLNGGAIPKEQFLDYHKNEQEIIIGLNTKINNAVSGIAISTDRILKSKAEVKEILGRYETEEVE